MSSPIMSSILEASVLNHRIGRWIAYITIVGTIIDIHEKCTSIPVHIIVQPSRKSELVDKVVDI
jgi:hypothetical protein